MKKLIHVSNLYTNEPALELAEKLIRHSPPKSGIQKVQFTNSGSEANETAINRRICEPVTFRPTSYLYPLNLTLLLTMPILS